MTLEGAAVQGSARLAQWLEEAGGEAELVRPGEETPTVSRAAAALGVPPSQIVKSVVFQHKRHRDRVCLAVVPGDARVDRAAVEAALGMSRLKLASPASVLAATGYEVGGVPPIGHGTPLPVVLDEAVLAQDVVYGGGGDELHMLRLLPREILRLTGAVVSKITIPAEGGREEEP